MHRILFFIFILIFSQSQAQNERGEIKIGLYNDSWGGGFTPIYDDLRAYHAEFEYHKPDRYKISSRYSLLSNRFDQDLSQRKLLDEFIINGSFSVVKFSDKESQGVWIKAGSVITGDLAGSQIQRITHNIFGVTQTDLNYDTDKKIYPSIGYSVHKNILTKNLSNGRMFLIDLDHCIDHHHNYMSNIGFRSSLTLKTNNTQVSFIPGYYSQKSHVNNSSILTNVLNAESGFGLELKITSKTVFYHFRIFPSNDFSYGGIGVWLNRKKNSEINDSEKRNSEIEIGVLSNGYGYNFKYSLKQFLAFNRKSKIILNHNYHTLLKKFVPESPEVSGHANQFSAGIEIQILKPSKPRILEPFINLSLGDKAISIYSKIRDIEKTTSHHLLLNNDLGVNIQFPIKINGKVNPLAFSFYHRFTSLKSLTHDKEYEQVSLENNPYSNVQNAIGFGIRVKI